MTTFPTSPSNGATFTNSRGTVFTYDGTLGAWYVSGGSGGGGGFNPFTTTGVGAVLISNMLLTSSATYSDVGSGGSEIAFNPHLAGALLALYNSGSFSWGSPVSDTENSSTVTLQQFEVTSSSYSTGAGSGITGYGAGSSYFSVADSRWPSSAPTGTWAIQSLAYYTDEAEAIVTVIRTA